jgi:hypothetical protein
MTSGGRGGFIHGSICSIAMFFFSSFFSLFSFTGGSFFLFIYLFTEKLGFLPYVHIISSTYILTLHIACFGVIFWFLYFSIFDLSIQGFFIWIPFDYFGFFFYVLVVLFSAFWFFLLMFW